LVEKYENSSELNRKIERVTFIDLL